MTDLVLNLPSRLFFGPSAVSRAIPLISSLGNRLLLITEDVLQSQHQVRTVKECLEKHGASVIVFDEVLPGSGKDLLSEAVRLVKTSRAELVLGFGGMRTLSTAKCTASSAGLPYVEIPGTCRNPFQFSGLCYRRFLEHGEMRSDGRPAECSPGRPRLFHDPPSPLFRYYDHERTSRCDRKPAFTHEELSV